MPVLDAGFEPFPPGKPYPARGHHSAPYLYAWEQGRVFSEYQFLAITRGEGILETATCPHLELYAGDLFILFPGEWHRFKPDPQTGWDENFVGFDGDYARHLMPSFFMPGEPVLRGAATPETVQRIRGIALLANDTAPETGPQVFADMITLITRSVLFMRAHTTRGRRAERAKINAAREHILERAFQRIDFRFLATSLGLSYCCSGACSSKRRGMRRWRARLTSGSAVPGFCLSKPICRFPRLCSKPGLRMGFIFKKYFPNARGRPLPPAAGPRSCASAMPHGFLYDAIGTHGISQAMRSWVFDLTHHPHGPINLRSVGWEACPVRRVRIVRWSWW